MVLKLRGIRNNFLPIYVAGLTETTTRPHKSLLFRLTYLLRIIKHFCPSASKGTVPWLTVVLNSP